MYNLKKYFSQNRTIQRPHSMSAVDFLRSYPHHPNIWDEMYNNADIRSHYKGIHNFLSTIALEELNKKEELAKTLFMSQGVTFTVYSSGEGIEKIFPFDIIPRII